MADWVQISGPEGMSMLELIWSDYLAQRADRPEPHGRRLLLWPLRVLVNPSLQLAFLVRVAQRGPRPVRSIVRLLQVWLFSSEIHEFGGEAEAVRIGPGINFPHPINILIAPGSTIGANVSIYNNVSMGTDEAGEPSRVWHRAAAIGDNARILPYTTLMGPYTVGHEAAVGMHVTLNENVPAGGRRTIKRLRAHGEWERAALGMDPPVGTEFDASTPAQAS